MTMNVEQAKQVLKDAGYFVDNLWHINDIKDKYNCDSDEQVQSILYNSLTNESVMEHIWDSINMIADEENLEVID
jgi:hypothetical protein